MLIIMKLLVNQKDGVNILEECLHNGKGIREI